MIVCLLIVVSAAIQWGLTIWFAGRMRARVRPQSLPEEHQHSTWIVLSVRGADPTLADALQSLLSQDFHKYRMCVVVDHRDDPAAKIVRDAISDQGSRVVVRYLNDPLPNCTLKCSAIAEGVEHVLATDADAEYFVFVDADSRPPTSMMKTLTGALFADAKVGLASGNQWFEPAEPASAGSIVRSLWYAGALFFSMLFNNPWAGAYAMRARDIRQTGLIDVWRRSAVDDGAIKSLLAKHDLCCCSLPSMMMVNRESCTLRYTTAWMKRILTWSRIHEPGFWLTAFQMSFATTLIVAIFSTLLWSLLIGNMVLLWMSAISIVVSGWLSVLAWRTVRQSVVENSEAATDLGKVSWQRMLAALLLVGIAQAAYTIACVGAIFSKKVRWRGVEYQISKNGVNLKEYLPYSSSKTADQSI